MVTLTFVFNKEKVKASGYTEDELLQPMREHAENMGFPKMRKVCFQKMERMRFV